MDCSYFWLDLSTYSNPSAVKLFTSILGYFRLFSNFSFRRFASDSLKFGSSLRVDVTSFFAFSAISNCMFLLVVSSCYGGQK